MKRNNLLLAALGVLLMLWPFTRAGAQSTGLEYWFDQYDNPTTIGMPTAGGTLTSYINVSHLTQGLHTIYMRVKANGVYSPVTSSPFIKFTTTEGGASTLEDWFDQEFDKKSTIPISVTTAGEQVLTLDLTDAVAFPYGLHRLNMRVVANGGQYSPIYSSLVMRLPDGQKNELSYWLDDDYKNGRHVIKAKKMEGKDALFDATLNLSAVAPGMHRFKYRITTNGFDDGVIYEEPILVTKKYNSQGEVFVVGESRWFDEQTPGQMSLSNPQSLTTRSYVLNPSDYSDGQHVYYVQYQNSADVWSEVNATYFYKEAVTGRLRIGIMPSVVDGIDEADQPERIACYCDRGTVYVDCQSPKLASTGIVQIFDLTGKMVAQQTVNNQDGIHSEISVDGYAKQLLIVRVLSGELLFNKKIMVQ